MKVNFGQIGVGYWGPNLLRNLVANPDCEVKRVVDLSEDRRNFVSTNYPSVEVSEDVDSILNDKDISAVIISTPVNTHFDLAKRALLAGKHILVEKPIATEVKQLEELDAIATKNDLVICAGHTFLYNSAVRYVKKLIDSGELGDIRYIYCQRLNLGRIRSDVDALWNFAPHDISIMQYWLNEPNEFEVSKRGMDYVQNGVDDVVFLNILYPKNIMVNIHVSWLDPLKVRRITVVGSKKMVVYDDVAENKIMIYDKGIDHIATLGERMDFDRTNVGQFNLRSGDVLIPKIDWQEPLKVEIEHFVDCILNGTKCLTDINHAKNVVRILTENSDLKDD
ncbi:Gfo/Idh/MocA family oxidoreductase [Candidatus Marinimicrobia bacterium MT.SAG.3]|nr:Gfo/Idh/MocA family oxidoreductase [Candidatus Marinimicrobia bacterium MT.SAG.3]